MNAQCKPPQHDSATVKEMTFNLHNWWSLTDRRCRRRYIDVLKVYLLLLFRIACIRYITFDIICIRGRTAYIAIALTCDSTERKNEYCIWLPSHSTVLHSWIDDFEDAKIQLNGIPFSDSGFFCRLSYLPGVYYAKCENGNGNTIDVNIVNGPQMDIGYSICTNQWILLHECFTFHSLRYFTASLLRWTRMTLRFRLFLSLSRSRCRRAPILYNLKLLWCRVNWLWYGCRCWWCTANLLFTGRALYKRINRWISVPLSLFFLLSSLVSTHNEINLWALRLRLRSNVNIIKAYYTRYTYMVLAADKYCFEASVSTSALLLLYSLLLLRLLFLVSVSHVVRNNFMDRHRHVSQSFWSIVWKLICTGTKNKIEKEETRRNKNQPTPKPVSIQWTNWWNMLTCAI